MVRQDRLAAVLSEFASTMLTDFPIQRILDHLVQRIVATLPVSAVGITLISAGSAPLYVAASDESALRFERLQTDLGQGPCTLAFAEGEAVSIPDLHAEDRFPQFVAAACGGGLGAAFAFPLRHGDGRLGALDLYRNEPGPLDDDDMAAGQILADVAAAYILNAQAREEAQAASDRFKLSALHDALTGLPNRLLLHQRLAHAASRAERSRSYAAVLFADLDHFKAINDRYGHPIGDELLVAVAQRLSELVRPGDTLARISGDEFVFLCEDMKHPEDVEVLAARIHSALAMPFQLPTVLLTVSASVGIAYAGPGQAVTNQLVVDADMAMYQAKHNGRATHQIIDVREAGRKAASRTLEHDLKAALLNGELDLAYQPIVRSGDGAVTGAEALLRWQHPQRGHIPAADIVAAAEASGCIAGIGAWALEAGCRARARWLELRPDHPLDLAVNVSAQQLMEPGFCNTVADILTRTRSDPVFLVLELTESILFPDAPRALSVLADLKACAIRLALDDFGTGYSSLSYLRDFPVDIVKIDRKFVAGGIADSVNAAIVEAITRLAHALDLTVIAEGVETSEDLAAVRQAGCDLAQGYYFGRPMLAAAMDELLVASGAGELRLVGGGALAA